MNTVVICIDSFFPRGDAGSNRVFYLAKALRQIERNVVVVSIGNKGMKGEEIIEETIKCNRVMLSASRVKQVIEKKLLLGELFARKLNKLNYDNYSVLIYGSNSLFVEPILKHCIRKSIPCYLDVVEWHQPYQYSFGRFDPRFWASERTFKKLSKECNGIIAITTYIKEYMDLKGCRSIIVPPIIDCDEVEYDSSRMVNQKIHIIYSGNPENKDDLLTMLKGLALLNSQEQERIVFQLTGTDIFTLKRILHDDMQLIEDLKCFECLGRLPYENLLDIYRHADCLYFSRPENRVTLANFPSKLPEMMQYGIVPIISKVGDYPKYLKNNVNCIFIEENTPEACVSSLRKYIDLSLMERKNMRDEARNCAVQAFDYRRWGSVLQEL